MKILLLNQDWFKEEFQAHGHEVVSCGTATHLDVVLPTPCLDVTTVISEFLGGFEPDVILWLDNSAPLFLTGLDETAIPTAMYSVDTHHHAAIHRYLAHIFDLCYIAQKDYLPKFHEVGADASWLPLYASRYVEQSSIKKHGAVFVGNLNAHLNPERVRFFEALTREVPLLTMTGDYTQIFPFSELVINQTVKGDLNFRVFESMMCGSLLLTEKAGNGLFDLFQDGVHLISYEKNNVEDAAQKIRECLSDLQKTRRIAAAGREEILRKHLPRHRAETVLKDLTTLKKKKSLCKHFSNALNFSLGSRTVEEVDTSAAARCLVAAMKSLEEGLETDEQLLPGIVCEAIFACLRYDQTIGSGAGAHVLMQLAEKFPSSPELVLAKIRCLLNSGKIGEATAIAERLAPSEPSRLFAEAEAFASSILSSSALLKFNR